MKIRHHEIIDHLANRAHPQEPRHQLPGGHAGHSRAADDRPGAPARADRGRNPLDGRIRRADHPARLGADLAIEGRAARGAHLRLGLAPHARQAHDGAAQFGQRVAGRARRRPERRGRARGDARHFHIDTRDINEYDMGFKPTACGLAMRGRDREDGEIRRICGGPKLRAPGCATSRSRTTSARRCARTARPRIARCGSRRARARLR